MLSFVFCTNEPPSFGVRPPGGHCMAWLIGTRVLLDMHGCCMDAVHLTEGPAHRDRLTCIMDRHRLLLVGTLVGLVRQCVDMQKQTPDQSLRLAIHS